MQGLLLSLPAGVEVEDLSFYKDSQLALLLVRGGPGGPPQPAAVQGGGEGESGGGRREGQLLLLRTHDLPLQDLPPARVHAMDMVQVGFAGEEAGGGIHGVGMLVEAAVQVNGGGEVACRWPHAGLMPGSGLWPWP